MGGCRTPEENERFSFTCGEQIGKGAFLQNGEALDSNQDQESHIPRVPLCCHLHQPLCNPTAGFEPATTLAENEVS